MNDLDELLRRDGHGWITPSVASPDLDAALAQARQRRSRVGPAATLVAVVALAAGGVILINPPMTGTPAVPVAPPTVSAPGATPSVTPSAGPPTPAVASMTEVARAVREEAGRYGIVASAAGVRSTILEARNGGFITRGESLEPVEAEVWVVQAQGEFNCDSCTTTKKGPEAGSSYLTLVLDANSLRVYHHEGADTALPLAGLGKVITINIA